jgi:hypothetical protein
VLQISGVIFFVHSKMLGHLQGIYEEARIYWVNVGVLSQYTFSARARRFYEVENLRLGHGPEVTSLEHAAAEQLSNTLLDHQDSIVEIVPQDRRSISRHDDNVRVCMNNDSTDRTRELITVIIVHIVSRSDA